MKNDETQTPSKANAGKSKFGRCCSKYGINSNLLMLKLTLFVMHGATASLLPYLTIHMQSVGLTVEEIAIIYLALPFTTFIAPPITGFLVDKFGKFKPVLIITLLLNAVFHHALYIIPQQEVPGLVPASYIMRHPETGNVEVWWSPCPSRECPDDEEIKVVVDTCFDHCTLLEQNPKVESLPAPTKLPSGRMNDLGELDDLDFKVSKKKAKELKEKSDRMIGIPSISTPSTTVKTIPITLSQENQTFLNFTPFQLEESEEESWVAGSGEAAFFLVDMHPDLGGPIEHMGMEVDDEDSTAVDFIQRFGEKLLLENGVNVTELEENDLRCGGIVLRHNITVSEERLKELAEDCMVQKCEFLRGGPVVCPPVYEKNDEKIFWIYFIIRLAGTMMLSGSVTMMDPVALTMIEEYGGDFGRERLFSMFGMAIISPITGFLIDYFSRDLGYTDYSSAFYVYDVLLIISCIAVFFMPIGDKLPADNVFRNLYNLLKMPHVSAFIIFLFVLGNFWGFIESFLFLYLKELGAPNYLLGITITVGTVSSIPFLYTAEKITRVFGHVNLIVIAFLAHSCRLVGYSMIDNAWWCFPFEAMEAFSCHLLWVAAATYCSILAPKGLLASLIGILGMAHYSLGRGSGSFVGGFLIGEFGTRDAFRYMGMIAVVSGIAYKIIHILWLKKFDARFIDDEYIAESGESEKLYANPKMRDAATSMSTDRLATYPNNHISSLTSLSRGSYSRIDLSSLVRRRSSISMPKDGSILKVDLIRSAIDIDSKKSSNATLSKDGKNSLRSIHHDSAPKLSNNSKYKSDTIVDEVPEEVVTSSNN